MPSSPSRRRARELALVRRDAVHPELAQVADRGGGAGDPLEVDRARLPRVGRLVGGRPHLVRAVPLEQLAPARRGRRRAGRRTCRPSRRGSRTRAPRRRSRRAARSGRRRCRRARPPRGRARSAAATSLTVPAPFDAQPNAATRVRPESLAAKSSTSTTHDSGSIPAWRTVTPRSLAASSQGATLASWSRPVTSTSSPGPSVAAEDPRGVHGERRHVGAEDDLGAGLRARGTPRPRSARSSSMASLASEVTNGPPRLAFCVAVVGRRRPRRPTGAPACRRGCRGRHGRRDRREAGADRGDVEWWRRAGSCRRS